MRLPPSLPLIQPKQVLQSQASRGNRPVGILTGFGGSRGESVGQRRSERLCKDLLMSP